jgi:hypothetical protein
MRGFKSAVSNRSQRIGFLDKIWQRNYYDTILWNEEAFERTAAYIRMNPLRGISHMDIEQECLWMESKI